MQYITLDAETYYDDEYSLRKMTPVEYVLDPRFEMIMLCVKPYGQPGRYLEGQEIADFFRTTNPNDVAIITHNALFDMCIFAWRYNFIPRLMIDTLGISRAMLGHALRSLSLSSVATHLGLGFKGNTVHKVKGMSAAAIKAAGLWQSYGEYNLGDGDLAEGIFRKLVLERGFPASELAIMNMVLRCCIRPQILLDQQALVNHLHNIRQKKEVLLAQAMICGANDRSALMSNDQFAEILRQLGVEPPTKISPVTGRTAYAFAKTDEAFLELQEHENPAVQVVVAARLGHKSTIEETRTERFLNIAKLQWPQPWKQQAMPIPLRYGGAHTHRLSGDWKLNMQNLPSRGESKELRRALTAPPGHQIVVTDASQIEARIVATLCGQRDLEQAFADKRDVYCEFATDIFGFPVTKSHKNERFVGKTSILQLGFGAGWVKFQWSIAMGSLSQTGSKMDLSDEEANRIVTGYRNRYPAIPATWKALNYTGIGVLAGNGGSFSLGPCVFEKGRISLPSGLYLTYHDLRYEDGEWKFTYGGVPKRLYGGALLENIVQALARIIVMDAALRIEARLAQHGVYLAMQVHDELVYVVPDHLVDFVKQVLDEEMTRRPAFLPTLPLACDVESGPNYAEAK